VTRGRLRACGVGEAESNSRVRMNRIEKLRGNIESLRDSLAHDWSDLAIPLTASNEPRSKITSNGA
jgi:hypothetical protein